VVGLPHPEVVKLFQKDPDTKAIVIFGEIGGTQEERVADLIEAGELTKPVIAYIGGKAAKSGTRFSHAGAIIEATAALTRARLTASAPSAPLWSTLSVSCPKRPKGFWPSWGCSRQTCLTLSLPRSRWMLQWAPWRPT